MLLRNQALASQFQGQAQTSSDGSFSLEGLPPGRHRIVAQGEGWTIAQERTVDLGLHESIAMTLEMTHGFEVSGRLETHGSALAPGMAVEARTADRIRNAPTTSISPDGSFRFPALRNAEYELVGQRANGRRPQTSNY